MNHQQGFIPGVTREFPVIKVTGDQVSETTVEVCTESRVVLSLNGVVIGDLSITPTDLEAFAVGHLICEGYLGSLQQITSISIALPEIGVTALCSPEKTIPGQFSKNSSGGSCRGSASAL